MTIHNTLCYVDFLGQILQNIKAFLVPADSLTAIEIVSHGNNNYRLWLGTTNGLAYCNLKL